MAEDRHGGYTNYDLRSERALFPGQTTGNFFCLVSSRAFEFSVCCYFGASLHVHTSPPDINNSTVPSHPSHHKHIKSHHTRIIIVNNPLFYTGSRCAPQSRHPDAPSLLLKPTAPIAATSYSTLRRSPSSATTSRAITSRVVPSASSSRCRTVASR